MNQNQHQRTFNDRGTYQSVGSTLDKNLTEAEIVCSIFFLQNNPLVSMDDQFISKITKLFETCFQEIAISIHVKWREFKIPIRVKGNPGNSRYLYAL